MEIQGRFRDFLFDVVSSTVAEAGVRHDEVDITELRQLLGAAAERVWFAHARDDSWVAGAWALLDGLPPVVADTYGTVGAMVEALRDESALVYFVDVYLSTQDRVVESTGEYGVGAHPSERTPPDVGPEDGHSALLAELAADPDPLVRAVGAELGDQIRGVDAHWLRAYVQAARERVDGEFAQLMSRQEVQ